MNRATTLAALAGLSISATAYTQQAPPQSPPAPGTSTISDPAKQPIPAAKAKPKTPVKPSIVDLQDAAKQPRKRAPRAATVAAPVAPAPVVPAPAPSVIAPVPAVVQPLEPIVAEPVPAAPSAPLATTPPAPPPAPAAVPAAVPTDAPMDPNGVSRFETAPEIKPVVDRPNPVLAPTAPTAPTPPNVASGPAVDIESVAVAPVKGELRRSPVEIGAEANIRSERQPVPAEPASPTPAPTIVVEGQPIDTPAVSEPVAGINDQRIPNPTASLLPSAPVQSVLSASFVDSLTSKSQPAPPPAVIEPEPAPAPGVPIATVEVTVPSKPSEAAPAVTPAAAPVEPARVAPVPVAPAAVEPKPVAAPAKPVEAVVDAPKPLDVKPAAEPLPPVQVSPTLIDTKPVEPKVETVAPTVTPLPAMPVEVKPVEVGSEAVKPAEVKGPEVAALDASKIKLTPPPAQPATATNSEPVAAPVAPISQPVPAPVAIEPSLPATQPTPVAQIAPATPITAPTTPATQPAVASEPEPVSLKVLSLTGTPGMVQWQIDGGTQWLIPELDETTKAKFVVRTGPDAGVEMLVGESTRVRLGRFSRAEVRTLDTTDEAGSGKRLNIQLMRGVAYVVPGKGQVITVQTPARAVVVKEPTQVTHDNSGTRSVSFTEQPNPGTSVTAPSANP